MLPISLLNEVNKQPPLELPDVEPSIESLKFLVFNKDSYNTQKDFDKYKKEKEARDKRNLEKKKIEDINADKVKSFSLDEFKKFGRLLGFDFSTPLMPARPFSPTKEAVPKSYKKSSNSLTISSLILLSAIFFVILFYVLSDYYYARIILGIPLVLSVLFLIGTAISGEIFTKYYWIEDREVDVKYKANEISAMEIKANEDYDKKLIGYKEQLSIYNQELIVHENKINQQIKDLNQAFPLIARQMWLQTIATNHFNINAGTPTNTSIVVQKLVAKLELLYPKNIKVGLKFPNLMSTAILLHINNSVIVNIEVDEPYDRETRKETNFIGSGAEGRDLICAENNMFVLRFSDSQVAFAMSECVSIVQELVLFTQNANTQHLLNISDTSKNIEVLCWTKEEARLMAMNEE